MKYCTQYEAFSQRYVRDAAAVDAKNTDRLGGLALQ